MRAGGLWDSFRVQADGIPSDLVQRALYSPGTTTAPKRPLAGGRGLTQRKCLGNFCQHMVFYETSNPGSQPSESFSGETGPIREHFWE